MNIAEMHVWFRQYAQQMGMQNVRAILPEQIDVLINTAISDIVNQLVRENIGARNDRIVTDNSKIGQINALRSLYKVKLLDMADGNPFMGFLSSDRLTGRMSNKYNGADVGITMEEYLYLVDFSISYKRSVTGFSGASPSATGYIPPMFNPDSEETIFFPVRLIEDAYLADSLNDSILKNRIRTPILVTYNDGTFDLYIDEFKKIEVQSGNVTNYYYVLNNNLIPFKLRVSYIAKPASVKYATDIGGMNVDCNLPESMHVDILKHAVDLYTVSVRGGLYNYQQNQQNQQQETIRNESRPVNEGYQN